MTFPQDMQISSNLFPTSPPTNKTTLSPFLHLIFIFLCISTHPPQLRIHGPRLRGQLIHHIPQHGIRAPDILDRPVQLVEQLVDLAALLAHVVRQEGVLGLRGLQACVEEGLVRGEGGGEVCGEDILGGEEMGAEDVSMGCWRFVVRFDRGIRPNTGRKETYATHSPSCGPLLFPLPSCASFGSPGSPGSPGSSACFAASAALPTTPSNSFNLPTTPLASKMASNSASLFSRSLCTICDCTWRRMGSARRAMVGKQGARFSYESLSRVRVREAAWIWWRRWARGPGG